MTETEKTITGGDSYFTIEPGKAFTGRNIENLFRRG
jgi:hypothetical protein